MPEKDPNSWGLLSILINYAWLLIALPLKLIWDRGNTMQAAVKNDVAKYDRKIEELSKKIDSHANEMNKQKLHIANHYLDKDETRQIIESSIKPVKEGVDRIESLLNKNLKFHD